MHKISPRFVTFKHFTLVGGVGNHRSITDCISGSRKVPEKEKCQIPTQPFATS